MIDVFLLHTLQMRTYGYKWPLFIVGRVAFWSPLVISWLVAWHSGRTSVFGRRTFPVLRSTCS